MKKFLIILAFFPFSISLFAQQSVLSSFNGYGDIVNVIDVDPTDSLFTIDINNFYGSPRFQPYGPWIAQDVQVGMVMWVDCARFVITNVNSASFSTMSIDVKVPSVDWNLGVATPLPNSRCAVVYEDQYLLTALPAPADGNSGALSGINNTLFACMLNHYSQALLVTKNSVNEITDYVAGLDTIPSEAPGPNIGETWRNSVGQLFYSDGTQWLTDKEIKFSNIPLEGLPSYLYKLGIDTLGQDTLYISNNGTFKRFQSGLVYKEGYGINIFATDSIEVDTNQIATQYDISLLPTGIDTFQLNNDTLKLSLVNDFEPFKKVILPVVGINSGTGISTSSTSGIHTITNTAPDQIVSITGAGISNVTGTYPNFTVTSTEVDGSVTNEGSLSVGAGTGTTSIIQSNTSGSNPITLTGVGITTVNETGNTITITSTEVDGSTTNELQTLSTLSNTVTLSNSGGSFTIAGAGINTVGTVGSTITVTGTEVDGSISNEGILGVGAGSATSSTILSNTSTSTPITLNAAGIISITETASSNGGSITLTGTEVDGSITNEIQDLSLSGQTLSLSSDPTTVTLPVIGITAGTGISTSSTSGNFTITNTGDLSNTNELQQIDTFRVNGANLELSLQNDNQSVRTVPLSSIVTSGGGLTGNGVVNYLSQYNTTSTLDTTGIIWVGGRMGIGTNAPTDQLHTTGSVRLQNYPNTLNSTGNPVNVLSTSSTGVVESHPISEVISAGGAITSITGGTGISVSTVSGASTITNTAPDQTVSITGAGINTVSGTYPNFTITGTEVDGSTTNELQTLSTGTNTLTLSNGGGTVTVDTDPSDDVTGSGASGQVSFWTGAQTQSGSSDFTWNNTNKILSFRNGSIITEIRVSDLTGNSFFGRNAGASATGTNNSFFGSGAGQNNTGISGTFFGVNAGLNNQGNNNSLFGLNAGQNSTGGSNCFFGNNAGVNNISGIRGSSFGIDAGRYINSGANLTVADNSIFFGFDSRALGDNQSNQIVIGSQSRGLGTNTTVLGNSSTTQTWLGGSLTLGTQVTPAARLHVVGSGTSSSTWTAQFHNSAGNNNALMIRDDGRIGVGTTVMNGALNINSNGGWNIYTTGTSNNFINTKLGIGATDLTSSNFRVGSTLTGSIAPAHIRVDGTVQSDVTIAAIGVYSRFGTAAGGALTSLNHFYAEQEAFNGTVTNQIGYAAGGTLVGATNNYGFYGNIPAGTGRWNFYANGTARNYFAGNTAIGTTSQNASSAFEVASTTQGILFPRMTTTQRNAIISPAAGLTIYNTTDGVMQHYNGSTWTDERDNANGLSGLGVTNYLAQYNSSNTLDTTGVIWTGGRLGIGATTPSRTLHVTGEARITDLTTDTPTRIVGADTDGDLGEITLGSGLSITSGVLNTSSTLNTGSGTTNYVTKWTGTNAIGNSQIFDDGTNVGIGTTTMSHKLTVNGDISLTTNNTSLFGKSTGGSNLSMFKIDGSNNLQFGSVFNGANSLYYAATDHVFYNYPSSTVTQTAVIKQNGNMGIGATVPSARLHVVGSDNLAATSAILIESNNGTDLLKIQNDGQITVGNTPAATVDTDKFLVNDGGVIKTRTGDQVLQDINVPTYVASRGENLVTNGSGLLENNYNFPGLTFDKSDSYYASGSFKSTTTLNGTFITTEFIPVDPTKEYKGITYAKANPFNASSIIYFGVAMYDVDNLLITPNYHMYRANTLTTLAQPLNPGDTLVYLTSAANWYNSANSTERSIIFWDYANSGGYVYPELTYSRNSYINIYNSGQVNYTTNTIRLTNPWSGPVKPAGTKLSNTNNSSTYKYFMGFNTTVPNSWTKYEGVISGVDNTGSNVLTSFAPGTAKVKMVYLTNFNTAGSVIWLSNLQFSENQMSSNGTANYIPKFSSRTNLSNSVMYESSSKIGIGTTSPNTPLEIKSISSKNLRLQSANNGYWEINTSYSNTDADLFFNNGSNRVSIDNLGNTKLLTGSLTVGNITNSAKLHVVGVGTTNGYGLIVTDVNNNTATASLVVQDNGRVGIKNNAPAKTLHVTGEVRISDLDNGTATRIVGATADGDLDELAVGSGLNITSGTISVTNPISASEVFIESSTATTIDLDANAGVVKDVNGTNASFTYPTDLSRLSVYKNGIRLSRTGSVTTRDFSVNTTTNEITFSVALVSTDRIVIVKI